MKDIKISIDNFGLNEEYASETEFIPIVSDESADEVDFDMPDTLPILPLRNTVLFPGVIVPISLGRDKSLKLVREVQRGNGIFGAVAQKQVETEEPGIDDIYKVGTVAKVIKMLEMPDGSTSAIIQGKVRFKMEELLESDPFFKARVSQLQDIIPLDDKTRDYEALVSSLKDLSLRIIKYSSNIPPEASFAVKNIENATFLINFICSNAEISVKEKQDLLQMDELKEKGMKLLEHLTREVQLLELKSDIQSKVKLDIDQQQREYMLHQQMKTIQDELGSSPLEQEVRDLKALGEKKKWGKEISELFYKEVDKLERLNPASGEYSVQHNYLQTLLDIPWNEYTEDRFDMESAEKVLDRDHFGLDGVKERILEHLAVLKLKGDLKSPIICLYGPPGVGKTSLGKSVADALGRKYARMSLGGVHDESEIRGHRKTYIGAMPGRIIHNIKKAGSANPVFILDEIDKIGSSGHGDPASALLEVLDPEQNEKFHDNFLEVDFDLSKVIFIATANTLGNISQPLLDRMELIEVTGYILDEKCEIAKRHLWPKQLENHGIPKSKLTVSKKTMSFIIENYTRESGVRELNKTLAKLARKYALKIATGKKVAKAISIDNVKENLGVERFTKEKWQDSHVPGVVTGLAWTAVGGEILYVESSLSKGIGKLTLTGNLGDVMKESAVLALEYIKSNCKEFGINEKVFDQKNIHVHVPEGAIPKDGPSAGITMATALMSAFTGRKVKKRIAMTGEITLRGKVLPVGGIKEKILAAKRAGIKEIILSNSNLKDVAEIKDMYIEGLEFHYVNTIKETLDHVLV
ncbi:ATP-dependent Lon protease [Saccharicrinis carchari]|uniref:Lon protease n=1 Tax=Saccharicrinis carchari TaxID=1168039 RepID=A0A521EIL2_SACCC|nr:endopeptidase La [Saccharicrinis carchari]SMO83748.1 ATP-dependent Lon protease [Saccharicrinis carchari]